MDILSGILFSVTLLAMSLQKRCFSSKLDNAIINDIHHSSLSMLIRILSI